MVSTDKKIRTVKLSYQYQHVPLISICLQSRLQFDQERVKITKSTNKCLNNKMLLLVIHSEYEGNDIEEKIHKARQRVM